MSASCFDSRLSREGWAVYATELAHESGYHDECPLLDSVEQSLDRAYRAFDAAFEVLLHTRSATPAELLHLLELYYGGGPLSLADLGDRARAYYRYSDYFLGDRAVRELRDAVRTEQGSRFDRRVFHERFLRAGFVPPSVLEAELLANP